MATTTIKIGHIADDLGMVASAVSPKPPFRAPVGINSKQYTVNVDFPSGNGILIEIEGTDGVRFAAFQSMTGAVIAHTEADLASPRVGKSFALAAQTASFKSLILFNT